MSEPIITDGILTIGNPNIIDIMDAMNNIIQEDMDDVMPEVMPSQNTQPILDAIVPVKSPLFKRKNNTDEKQKQTKNITILPIYYYKFNEIIKPNTTNKTTITSHKIIVDNILELYIKNGQHKVSEYTICTAFSTDKYSKTLLQYSIDCALNVVNSRDIIFYHDKIRDLICVIAFLSNLGLILGGGDVSKYLRENGWPDVICKLVNNVFPIMAYHSSKDNIKCIQEIIDGLRGNENIDTLEYKELSLVIHKCMKTRICNTREKETECYLNEYIKPKLVMVLQSF